MAGFGSHLMGSVGSSTREGLGGTIKVTEDRGRQGAMIRVFKDITRSAAPFMSGTINATRLLNAHHLTAKKTRN